PEREIASGERDVAARRSVTKDDAAALADPDRVARRCARQLEIGDARPRDGEALARAARRTALRRGERSQRSSRRPGDRLRLDRTGDAGLGGAAVEAARERDEALRSRERSAEPARRALPERGRIVRCTQEAELAALLAPDHPVAGKHGAGDELPGWGRRADKRADGEEQREEGNHLRSSTSPGG